MSCLPVLLSSRRPVLLALLVLLSGLAATMPVTQVPVDLPANSFVKVEIIEAQDLEPKDGGTALGVLLPVSLCSMELSSFLAALHHVVC